MNQPLRYQDENKKWVSLNGYAFIDDNGHCIMIVYGEGRRDALSKYLSEDGDVIGIKYKTICLRSSTDRTSRYERLNGGSIPSEGTNIK